MISTAEIKQFDWKTFSVKVKRLLEFASQSTIAPVNAERWEEIVFHALKSMGQKYNGGDPKWEIGSHAPGADLWTDVFAISVKAGKVQNGFLTLSSYRLTRFNELNEMKIFIDGLGKNFNFYLCCARIDSHNNGRIYKIFIVPADIFIAKKLNWSKTTSGWRGVSNNGVIVTIRKKMSNQLWIEIPVVLCTQIGEILIPKRILGSALHNIAKR